MKNLYNNTISNRTIPSFFRLYNLETYLAWQGNIWANVIDKKFLLANKNNKTKKNAVEKIRTINSVVIPADNGILACAIAKCLASYNVFPKLIVTTNGSTNPSKNKLLLSWIEYLNGQMISVSEQEIKKASMVTPKYTELPSTQPTIMTIAALQRIQPEIDTNQNILLIFPRKDLDQQI